jgi:hypothetical protein
LPDLEGAVQAVAFPLEVEGPVYLRDANGSSCGRFDVPPGAHDVLVRFFPREADAEDAEVGLRSWPVVVSFLPSGSAALLPARARRAAGRDVHPLSRRHSQS